MKKGITKTIEKYSTIQIKELNSIRITNLVSMNLFILLVLPWFAHKLGWKNDIWGISILGIYFCFLPYGFLFILCIEKLNTQSDTK